MISFKWFFLGFFLTIVSHATPAEHYLQKFMKFQHWKHHLPVAPDDAFLSFISKSSPLEIKLREQWLYDLAYNKKWALYTQYYQSSKDINLQCYEQIALYQQGQTQKAITVAKTLWLNGQSEPKACTDLFKLLLIHHNIDNILIEKRIFLALNKKNITLATALLRQHTPSLDKEIQTLRAIDQHPRRITALKPSPLHSEFYLYGLTKLLSHSMDQAIRLFQRSDTRRFLNPSQQQKFLAQVAFYKAIQDAPDASAWFAKVSPAFYNDDLLGAEIRFALKNNHWSRVKSLINFVKEQNNPCWQYWLARANEVLGKKESAAALYQNLSTTRHYYGFLASLRLHKRFSFENERIVNHADSLRPYQPITSKIKALYLSRQSAEASRLINDFITELPKADKTALTYWIENDLQWHAKSVSLTNNGAFNNQLSLRFPLAYRDTVLSNAKTYQIPKEMIYAIIRQESAFSNDVVSSAGARGLMQLMPATAKSISKEKKIAYSNEKQLFSPQKNIALGSAYLQQLHKHFKNHPILVVAAYNAGPRQALFWLNNHPPKEMDVWIETLPWRETRNYLKNVMAFYAVYQYRLKENPDLSPFLKRL